MDTWQPMDQKMGKASAWNKLETTVKQIKDDIAVLLHILD